MTTNLIPTESEIEVMAHMKAIADKAIAWVEEDPTNRWCATEIYTLDHIRAMEYTSIAVYERKNLELAVYETTRGVYGYKPSFERIVNSTTEELKAEFESMEKSEKLMNDWALAETERKAAEQLAYETAHPDWARWEREEKDMRDYDFNFYAQEDQEQREREEDAILEAMERAA